MGMPEKGNLIRLNQNANQRGVKAPPLKDASPTANAPTAHPAWKGRARARGHQRAPWHPRASPSPGLLPNHDRTLPAMPRSTGLLASASDTAQLARQQLCSGIARGVRNTKTRAALLLHARVGKAAEPSGAVRATHIQLHARNAKAVDRTALSMRGGQQHGATNAWRVLSDRLCTLLPVSGDQN